LFDPVKAPALTEMIGRKIEPIWKVVFRECWW